MVARQQEKKYEIVMAEADCYFFKFMNDAFRAQSAFRRSKRLLAIIKCDSVAGPLAERVAKVMFTVLPSNSA